MEVGWNGRSVRVVDGDAVDGGCGFSVCVAILLVDFAIVFLVCSYVYLCL